MGEGTEGDRGGLGKRVMGNTTEKQPTQLPLDRLEGARLVRKDAVSTLAARTQHMAIVPSSVALSTRVGWGIAIKEDGMEPGSMSVPHPLSLRGSRGLLGHTGLSNHSC